MTRNDTSSTTDVPVLAANDRVHALTVKPGYTIDPAYLTAYEQYGHRARRRYPSQTTAPDAYADWQGAFAPSSRTGPPTFSEYTVAPKVPLESLLESSVVDRPPHPFDFVRPDTSLASSSSAALSIELDPDDPGTLKLLVVSIRKLAYLGFIAEAQSVMRKVWPTWLPDHESTSTGSSGPDAHLPSPASPPPVTIYLAIINGLLDVGMWEDALAWIETCIVKARHEVQPGTYLAFLRSFEWANDPVSAEALYESIKKDRRHLLDGSPRHAPFASEVFSSLIRGGGSASAAQRLQTAKHWMARMANEGHRPGLAKWTTFMEAATRANDAPLAQKVWKIIQEITAVERAGRRISHPHPRDTSAFNAFLHSLRNSRVGWVNVSPVLAEAIASEGLIPNLETYHLAIRSAVDGGFTAEAVEMIRFMEHVGVRGQTFKPTHVTFTILLAGLLRRHGVRQAEVRRVEQSRTFLFVQPWKTGTAGDGDGFKLPAEDIMAQTLAVVGQMKARGLQITATLYFAIIEYLGRLSATSETALRLANQLVNDLPKSGEPFTEKNRWAVPNVHDAVPAEEMLLLHIVRVYLNRRDDEMVRAVTSDLLDRRGEDINHRTVDELLRAATAIGHAQLVHHLWELAVRIAVKDAAGLPFETPVDPDRSQTLLLPDAPSSLTDIFSASALDIASPTGRPSSSSSSPAPTVPLVQASELCKAIHLLLVFYLKRGPISLTDLAYLTEQWRRVASLGFGLDSRCWAALAEVYLSVGEFEKAFQITNDIILWRNETLERRFEAKFGLTIRRDPLSRERLASADAWADEFARGKDELPKELDDAPDEFRRVVRTSFAMAPTDFRSRKGSDVKAQAFAMVFPPTQPDGGWPEQSTPPFAPQSVAPSDPELESSGMEPPVDAEEPRETIPGEQDDEARLLSDAPHLNLESVASAASESWHPSLPSRRLSPAASRLAFASPRLSHRDGLTPDHLAFHPAVVRAWKPSFRVLDEVHRIVLEMEGLAEKFIEQGGGSGGASQGENPVARLERFQARYARVMDEARKRADYKSMNHQR